MIHRIIVLLIIALFFSCAQRNEGKEVQQIVDESIEIAGGHFYGSSQISFRFRDKRYKSYAQNGKKVLVRETMADSLTIRDVLTNNSFERFFNDSLIKLPDSVSNRYANSVNSVHYFARLPYGLNDPAVNKTLLGEVSLNEKPYYKVKVTFDEQNGGEDFDDVYLYWFNKETLKPDFLAYNFHVDGGGIRFREAFNERYVEGIRFVDYNNYKADPKKIDFFGIDSHFEKGELELLSKIELQDIRVRR